MSEQNHLKTGLKSRHLSMISIAGVIGATLFVGSGKIIANSGPATIIAYTLGGILVFLIMRMLGEMAIAQPDTGSFSTYADRAIGRWAGFSIGWMYWFFWSLLLGWESYVAGSVLNSWFPEIPIWVYMLVVTVALVLVNLLNVKNYGEIEFWFALIKVVAIVTFMIIGSLAIVNIWPFGDPTVRGISHLTDQGFMPNGFSPVLTALLGVMFAFMGAEIVTVAASESENPSKEIAKASRTVVWRIILFYVGSIFIAVCLIPYNDPRLQDPTWGTYSVTLADLGVPYIQPIVSFVVLTSVCSCFNSALYTSSRMLYSLSKRGDAHKCMQITGKKTGSPWVGVLVSSLFGFLAVYLTATKKMDVYDVLMQATGTVALLVYFAIAVSQLKMRQKLEKQGVQLQHKMWCFPYLTYVVIIAIPCAIIGMIFEGTYRTEVLYTSLLAVVVVSMGLVAQKFNIGKSDKTHTQPSKTAGLEAE